MKRIIIATAMSLCMVLPGAISSADTLIMRDGTRVEGTVVGIAARPQATDSSVQATVYKPPKAVMATSDTAEKVR